MDYNGPVLKEAYDAGANAALDRFGVKTAWGATDVMNKAKGWGGSLVRQMIGHPDKIIQEGKSTFGQGGVLHASNVFWPKSPVPGMKPMDEAVGHHLVNPMGAHAAGTKVTPDMAKAFTAQGHHELNVNPNFMAKASPWLGRTFGTILPAYGAYKAITGKSGDPNESRLTNTLGAIGGGVGAAYGYSGLGALGGGIVAGAGARLGTGLGRMISRQPAMPQEQPQQYEQGYGQGQGY